MTLLMMYRSGTNGFSTGALSATGFPSDTASDWPDGGAITERDGHHDQPFAAKSANVGRLPLSRFARCTLQR